MHTALKILGIFFVVVGAVFLILVGLVAWKGFLTTNGLIVDFPRQGRVSFISLGTILGSIFFLLGLGSVLYFLGKPRH
ncbi:MAG: hypothetical protein ACRD52_18435 [Candidatus Acidiferrales bacterium]